MFVPLSVVDIMDLKRFVHLHIMSDDSVKEGHKLSGYKWLK